MSVMADYKVTFYPEGKSVEVPVDTTILRAAHEAGIRLDARCGGQGTCGACRVRVINGNVHLPPSGKLSLSDKKKGICLACLALVRGDLDVEVPFSSRLEPADLFEETGENSACGYVFSPGPLTEKFFLELPEPDKHDRLCDWERIRRHLRSRCELEGEFEIPLELLRCLPGLLRAAGWKVTVSLTRAPGYFVVTRIEAGDTSGENYGFCFDIGTTTISGQLVDLNARKPVSGMTVYNAQAAFGSDVISRIVHSQQSPGGLEQLRCAALEGVNRIAADLIKAAKLAKEDVGCVSFAGNTIMTHMLLGIEPKYIRREPYLPVVNELPYLTARESGICIAGSAPVYALPGVAGYAGGDLTAGVLACGMHRSGEVCLLIDVGTNGEIALGGSEFIVCAAASAGPAFEGSGVTCGMRAASGAIQKVSSPGRDGYEVNGDVAARGICGSGYIDLLAMLLREGIMDRNGRLKQEAPGVRPGAHGSEYLVCSSGGEDIVISEADIENLKRAKAAIYAAASALLKHVGMDFAGVSRVYISGGFGSCINVESAKEIGLLPALENKRFVFCGNTSLSGARSVLLSPQARGEAAEIASRMTYCELSLEPSYIEEYMAALFFPHTDLEGFTGGGERG